MANCSYSLEPYDLIREEKKSSDQLVHRKLSQEDSRQAEDDGPCDVECGEDVFFSLDKFDGFVAECGHGGESAQDPDCEKEHCFMIEYLLCIGCEHDESQEQTSQEVHRKGSRREDPAFVLDPSAEVETEHRSDETSDSDKQPGIHRFYT